MLTKKEKKIQFRKKIYKQGTKLKNPWKSIKTVFNIIFYIPIFI